MNENDYMKLAIEEAKKGMGFTSPNPMVGAVLVKDGVILGSDYHHKYGELHAERNVLLNCKEDVRGADLYVTLEPCAHQGKTPPCTDIIIEKGIINKLADEIKGFFEGNKVFILTDKNVDKYYGDLVLNNLIEEFYIHIIVFSYNIHYQLNQ